jgi:hypothetical protein
MRRSDLARVRDMEASLAAQERQSGADDPGTIDSRLRLVEAYEQLPDSEDDSQPWEDLAITEMAKAVDGRVRTLGPDHPDTLTVRFQVAFMRYVPLIMEPGPAAHAELVTRLRAIAADAERVLGPERRSLKVLMALLDILDCSMQELIEPIAVAKPARKAKAAGGADAGVGDLRPKRARIAGVDR